MLLRYFKLTVIFFALVGNIFIYCITFASTLISTYKYSEHDERTRDILVYKNYLYMANMYWGLRTVDISDIDDLFSVDHYYPGGGAESVELEMSGNTLFVADRVGGTKFFDISNPAAPSYLTTFPTYDRSSRLAVRGNNLFIGDRSGGLVVLDISNPAVPSEVGRHQRNYETQGIALKDDCALVANPWQGFYILDISDFSVMDEIAYYNKPEGTNPGIWDVGISNHYAYALCQSYGIHVIDISDPYSPQYSDELLLPLGKDPTGGDSPPLDIEFLGNYAFVSNGLVTFKRFRIGILGIEQLNT